MLRTGRQKERRRRTSQESRENVHPESGHTRGESSCRVIVPFPGRPPRLKLGRKMEFDVGKFFHCQGQRIGSIGQEYLASALV